MQDDLQYIKILDSPTKFGIVNYPNDEFILMDYICVCIQICEGQWTEHWNDPQQVPYATNGNQWVGYDNVRSITIKVCIKHSHWLVD